jgi:Mg/Co/Ni transporter MgtE
VDGRWEVVGVDPSPRAALRRLLPRPLARRIPAGKIADWATIEPFVGHVPSARLRIPYRKLARLHPAQIADLVEQASHEEGEEIIEAVGQDRELEADVFEELDPEHQIEFMLSRSDAEAARLLGTMAPDDAADLITELDQERRLPVLQLLAPPQQRKIRALLNYNPETAGGLMIPDFVCMAGSTPVERVLDALRASQAPQEALAVVFARDDDGRVSGSASVVALVQAPPTVTLSTVVRPNPAHVHPDWDLHAVTRKMADFNLTVAPVMDEHHHMVGVITVDDLLETILPTGWRRDFGMATVEE